MISAPESRLPKDCVARIRSFAEFECQRCNTPDELVKFAADADMVWLFGANVALTEDILPELPKCKAILRSGSGLDAIPVEAAHKLGIKVYNTPESISESVAEHAVSLLFALARHISEFDKQVRHGKWDSSAEQTHWHLTGRTLGLIGYGRIARSVEKMVSGFDMEVLHYDPFCSDSLSIDELLRRSDFVSLHCPLTPETAGLMNKERFAIMKPNALLVNTSRGGVINEADLVDALKNGTIGGAALDVLNDEPPKADNPLLNSDKVILTPHVAAFSADFEKNFWSYSVDRIEKALKSNFSE